MQPNAYRVEPVNRATDRKPYNAPTLIQYGLVRELTAGGSVIKHENRGHPDGKF
jgi:hypothetical protein